MVKCLCLHGFGENKEVYNPFVNEMSNLMETLSVDLIGHGEYIQDNYKVTEVLEYISSKILSMEDEVILVGTSFGGIISYIMSSNNNKKYSEARDKIKSIIINDVPCCIPKASFGNLATNLFQLAQKRYDGLEELDEIYEQNGFKLDRVPITDENWQHFLRVSVRDGSVRYDIKFIDTILSSNPEIGIASLADGIQFNLMPDGTEALDLRYYFDAIQKPILLFVGARTTFFPSHVHEFMALNPFVGKYIISNGGHFLDLSRDEIMRSIRKFAA